MTDDLKKAKETLNSKDEEIEILTVEKNTLEDHYTSAINKITKLNTTIEKIFKEKEVLLKRVKTFITTSEINDSMRKRNIGKKDKFKAKNNEIKDLKEQTIGRLSS